MSNPIYVLLFVLFPPPEVLVAEPDATPMIQAEQVESLDVCKADLTKLVALAAKQYPGADAKVACIGVPAPDTKPAKPGLQPNGDVLTPDGDIIKPKNASF